MNTEQVLTLLEAHKNEKGMQKWAARHPEHDALESYGIGLTQLRKLAKKIGRDHELALALWEEHNYDAKILGLLIDDPKMITREQAEAQVEHLRTGHLEHVFSSCDATLAKTPFVVELASDWVHSPDSARKSSAYGLLYEISKSKKKSAPDDAYFLDKIALIRNTFFDEDKWVQGSMAGALLGIGKRNKRLNTAALEVAKMIGPVAMETDGEACEPFNLEKHLSSDYLKSKFAD